MKYALRLPLILMLLVGGVYLFNRNVLRSSYIVEDIDLEPEVIYVPTDRTSPVDTAQPLEQPIESSETNTTTPTKRPDFSSLTFPTFNPYIAPDLQYTLPTYPDTTYDPLEGCKPVYIDGQRSNLLDC